MEHSPQIPWSADEASRQMWAELDKSATNGEMMSFYRRHLQAAFDAGRTPELKAWTPELKAWREWMSSRGLPLTVRVG